MEVAPLPMTDPWSDRIQRDPKIDAQMLRGVPSDIAVNMSMVEILHHGEKLNFRPYLHLQGRIDEVIPEVKLPYGVDKLPFKEDSGPSFDAFYEFSDDQLSDLVTKGYFTDKFKVPSDMSQTTWDLPGKADYLLVYPGTAAEPPLVFVGVQDRSEMTMTQASSEYDLHEYFPSYLNDRELPTENVIQKEDAQVAMQRSSELSDLFEGHEFEAPNELHFDEDFSSTENSLGTEEPEVPQGVFETLVGQARNEQETSSIEDGLSLLDTEALGAEGKLLSELAPKREVSAVEFPKAADSDRRRSQAHRNAERAADARSTQEAVEKDEKSPDLS